MIKVQVQIIFSQFEAKINILTETLSKYQYATDELTNAMIKILSEDDEESMKKLEEDSIQSEDTIPEVRNKLHELTAVKNEIKRKLEAALAEEKFEKEFKAKKELEELKISQSDTQSSQQQKEKFELEKERLEFEKKRFDLEKEKE